VPNLRQPPPWLSSCAVGAIEGDGAELVPPLVRKMYAKLAAQRARDDEAFAALVGPPVLPPVAYTYYTLGGCRNLALALHRRTRLPIELYMRGNTPVHCYVVSDEHEYAIDARGRIPLVRARAGTTGSPRVTRGELLELLLTQGPIGEYVRNPVSIGHANRAAAIVLAHG